MWYIINFTTRICNPIHYLEYNDCVDFINDKKDEVIEFQKGYDFSIDIEAELTGIYVEKYLNQNKDE